MQNEWIVKNMIVIKGNLILRQARNINRDKLGILTETSSDKEIVAFANLDDYDITGATILIGDVESTYLNDTVLVTGEVMDVSE